MPPLLRRLVAAAVLCGMLAPWGAVIGIAAHLATNHHDTAEHHHFDASALHGHGHTADTPDHEHGLSVPGGIDTGLRPPVINVAFTPWTRFAAASALPRVVPAFAPSPPRLAPIVLRT